MNILYIPPASVPEGGGSPHKARLSLLDQHLRDLLTDAYQIYTRS